MAKPKTVALPANFKFPEASLWLMRKEARGHIVSSIAITPPPESNSVKLTPHRQGGYPKDCILLPATDPDPAGHHQETDKDWFVLTEGKPRLSRFWRSD